MLNWRVLIFVSWVFRGGKQKFLSFWLHSFAFMSSLKYMCVSFGSSNNISAAPSMGRICLVFSSLRMWSSANLV